MANGRTRMNGNSAPKRTQVKIMCGGRSCKVDNRKKIPANVAKRGKMRGY